MVTKKELKKLLHKRKRESSSKKKRKHGSSSSHNKYYQSLYNKYYADSANDILASRTQFRDKEIDNIKERISILNADKKTNNESEIRKLSEEQKFLERQNVIDQQMASSLKIGNSIAHPLAKSLREADDQKIFGSQLYANSVRPNYMEMAKQSAAMKSKMNQFMSDPVNQMRMQMQMV